MTRWAWYHPQYASMNRYQNAAVYRENGLAAVEQVEEVAPSTTNYRIDYPPRPHLRQMGKAISEDGVAAAGLHVGPIDLVSASTGEMKKRYGFIYVDKDNTEMVRWNAGGRTAFIWYKKALPPTVDDLS